MSKCNKIICGLSLGLILLIIFICTSDWSLEKYKNISLIFGVVIALIVYITNSYFQYKQRISSNALRYMELHSKLFENKFLKDNIQAMEKGELERTKKDEQDFNRLLGEVEQLAFLAKTGVVSKTINIYMFGWFARHIQPLINDEERANIYWEVAVEFLDDLKKDADDFYNKSKEDRKKYFNKNHFFH